MVNFEGALFVASVADHLKQIYLHLTLRVTAAEGEPICPLTAQV